MTLPQHLQALQRVKRAKVDFLMVGALALNSFAPEIAATYSTNDCDVLVRPSLAHLRRALRELVRSGYALSVNDEPLVGLDDLILRRLLERRVTVRAEKDSSMPIDVMVEAIGYSFAQWWKGRRSFRAGSVRIPCASLEQVLGSKRAAGRDKDKTLLALYEAGVESRAAEARRPSRRRAK